MDNVFAGSEVPAEVSTLVALLKEKLDA